MKGDLLNCKANASQWRYPNQNTSIDLTDYFGLVASPTAVPGLESGACKAQSKCGYILFLAVSAHPHRQLHALNRSSQLAILA